MKRILLILIRPLKRFGLLLFNYFYDFWSFSKHSGVFTNNTQGKVLGKIIYYYHSVEKGLINEQIKFRFGKQKVPILIKQLKIWIERGYHTDNSQFIAGCSVLAKYYNIHITNKIDISDIVTDKDYFILSKYVIPSIGGICCFEEKNYFNFSENNFKDFSNSRHSVRHFNGEFVPIEVIEEVIKLTSNAPSVCNRQTVEVILVNNEELSQKVLKIQRGMDATAHTVRQVLIVTSNMNEFVSEVERNQMFVDGGIFLQNLLYSLHYHKIAACALNWSKPFFYDFELRKAIKLNPALRIIAVVAIGYPKSNFKVPYSKRKNTSEILQIIE